LGNPDFSLAPDLMNAGSRHSRLLPQFLAQAVLFCLVSALFTLVVAAVYGVLASLWQGGVAGFLPSGNAWEAALLGGVALALFNATGDSVEIDCDQGRTCHSAVTYGLTLATTSLFALILERVSHGTWLQPYVRTWLGAALVIAFLATKLLVISWHRKSLGSRSTL
jgi:hypothetical protein